MSHHTTTGDELFILLAGIRMLRRQGIAPSAQAFEQVVNEGLLDGAPDVTLCNQTFTGTEIRSFLASQVKHFHHDRCNAHAEHDPAGAFEAALDYPYNVYLAVEATHRMAEEERQAVLQKAMDDQDDWQAAMVSIELGLDVSTTDPSGKPWLSTVIHLDKGQTWVAEAMLNAGANPNERDGNGETPLHALAYGCEERLVKVLLDGGADPLIRDNFGRRPLDKVEGVDEDGKVYFPGVQIDEDDHEELLEATRRVERLALEQTAAEALNHNQPAPSRPRARL